MPSEYSNHQQNFSYCKPEKLLIWYNICFIRGTCIKSKPDSQKQDYHQTRIIIQTSHRHCHSNFRVHSFAYLKFGFQWDYFQKNFKKKRYHEWYWSWNHIWVIAWIRNPRTVLMNSCTALLSVNSRPEYCSSGWFLPWKLEGREGLSLICRWIYAALSLLGWTCVKIGPVTIIDRITKPDQKFRNLQPEP